MYNSGAPNRKDVLGRMGVPQLLPQLKDIQEVVSLAEFKGQTLAIDAYAWLHKSVMSCPVELGKGLYTDKYVNYFRRRVAMLRGFGVEPYFVFDGDKFSNKAGVENERERLREENKALALQYVENGDHKTAWKHFVMCVDVTPQMAKSVLEVLDQEKVQYVVAPYEADAQMVYLEKIGVVSGILSEDSDLLIFGAQCLLTKLTETGFCTRICRKDFKNCRIAPVGLLSDSQLRMVACLAGCDYTGGIPNVGIVKAFRLVKRMGTMQKCLANLRLEGKVSIPTSFEEEYERADLSFQFQRVFNPISDDMTTLNDIPESLKDHRHLTECIGPLLELDVHRGIARGKLDPITKDTLLTRESTLMKLQMAHNAQRVSRTLNPPRTPKPQTKIRTIGSYFKLSQPVVSHSHRNTPQRSPSLPSSIVSKRRKLFDTSPSAGPAVTASPSQSRFFQHKRKPEAVDQRNDAKPQTQLSHSSDFEFTDPDDCDDSSDHDSEPTESSAETGTAPIRAHPVDQFDASMGQCTVDSTASTAEAGMPLDGGMQCDRAQPVKRAGNGLYDKFGFRLGDGRRGDTAPTRPTNDRPGKATTARLPLRPKHDTNSIVTGTRLKHQGNGAMNATMCHTKPAKLSLDSFMYRGG